MDATIEAVSRLYAQDISIKQTATRVRCSEQKVRKILITLGQYSTPAIIEVDKMHRSGKSAKDIASELGLSRGAVSGMLPYSKGIYDAEYPTINALKIRRSRERRGNVPVD